MYIWGLHHLLLKMARLEVGSNLQKLADLSAMSAQITKNYNG